MKTENTYSWLHESKNCLKIDKEKFLWMKDLFERVEQIINKTFKNVVLQHEHAQLFCPRNTKFVH